MNETTSQTVSRLRRTKYAAAALGCGRRVGGVRAADVTPSVTQAARIYRPCSGYCACAWERAATAHGCAVCRGPGVRQVGQYLVRRGAGRCNSASHVGGGCDDPGGAGRTGVAQQDIEQKPAAR